ncbi:hypothetical protein [Tenacibaculum agarivorans]|uniref:hypothetical protein n=1 Tax=Tenacibaculum agarivorans TaxID=1908389 RepID=UPI00094BB8AC|nr:hypothetical protein [Tenacibaculum agarivorans]
MKKLVIGLIILTVFGCNQSTETEDRMKQAKIIELVVWKFKNGVDIDNGKKSVLKLNEFVSKQPGFISRKTALTEDGKFLDVILWSDLEAAKSASEKAMQNEMTTTIFNIMEENDMIFQHFELFNHIKK